MNMKKEKMIKLFMKSKLSIRHIAIFVSCFQLCSCAIEDLENFSSAMNTMNSELGYSSSGSVYESQYSNYVSEDRTTTRTSGNSESLETAEVDHQAESSNVIQKEVVVENEKPKRITAENKSQALPIHVYAIAYGNNHCGQETALGYAYSITDAENEVQEKRRLEASLESRYSGVSRCKSSSSKFDFGGNAKAVILISWQAGTKNCPTTVYSYVYGVNTQDAASRANAKFKLWAPGGSTMQTVDLRSFTN
jgi:hypothetical protein